MKKRPKSARELGIMEGFPPPFDKRVTLENWDRPPFNRWSFQNIREVLPTVAVSRGNNPVQVLERNESNFDNLIVNHPRNGSRSTVSKILKHAYNDGFIIIHKGKIVYERYLNDMQENSLHLSQSVAKSVTATVCGILLHRGLIDRDAPLAELIPELHVCGYADATLRQVLDMRSGVRFSEEYTDPDSDIAMVDYAAGWKPHRPGKPESVLDIPLVLPKEREHGGHFQYRSIETDVMAWVMQRATGKPIAQLVSEELWQPMGAEFESSYTIDKAGYALSNGGFNAALRDYARIGLLYLNNGKVDNHQIVPEEWVRETRQDGEIEAFAHSHWAGHWPKGAYKNQFWIRDVDKQQIMARGVFGQAIYVDPENELVMASLSTWPDFLNSDFVLDELDAVDAIAHELNSQA